MDRWEAQYGFWASHGVPAYEQNSVPDLDDVSFPYITYEAAAGAFGADIAVSASVWTRSTAWTEADELSDAIEARLGGKDGGGEQVPYDGGSIWITPEPNFSQPMGDPDDDRIKRKVLRVVLHFH